MMQNIEGVSPRFNLDTYFKVRKVAQKIMLLCASQVDVGMSEADGINILEQLCDNFGVDKLWHPHKFRIGPNTTKSFREKSDPNVKLQKDDIYFIDLGPVIDNHEADIGQTFTVGQNLEFAQIQKSSREIFNFVQKAWKEQGLTGNDLYQVASQKAQDLGYILNTKMNGHRLGDFPHGIYYKNGLSDYAKKPIENLWVLEVLIRHPEKEFGAFFEDILI